MKQKNQCENCGGALNEKGICQNCGYSNFSVNYDDLEVPFDAGCIGVFFLPFIGIVKTIKLLNKKIKAYGVNKKFLKIFIASIIIGFLYATLFYFVIYNYSNKTNTPENHNISSNVESITIESGSETSSNNGGDNTSLDNNARLRQILNNGYEEYNAVGKFDRVKATSYANWRGTVGFPYHAFDGNINTSWQDGHKDSYGIGDVFFSYNSDETDEYISSVTVYNGYQNTAHNTSSKDFYISNSRVRDFSIEFDNGKVLDFTLADTKIPQTFDFGMTVKTCFVKFKIKSVYEGEWSDTCISEIKYE